MAELRSQRGAAATAATGAKLRPARSGVRTERRGEEEVGAVRVEALTLYEYRL